MSPLDLGRVNALSDGESRQESVAIAGYAVRMGVAAHLAEELLTALDKKQQRILLFANANFAVQCRHLREAMNRDAVIVVDDGVGMDIAALLMRGRRFPENLNGTDFIPYFLVTTRRRSRRLVVGEMGRCKSQFAPICEIFRKRRLADRDIRVLAPSSSKLDAPVTSSGFVKTCQRLLAKIDPAYKPAVFGFGRMEFDIAGKQHLVGALMKEFVLYAKSG